MVRKTTKGTTRCSPQTWVNRKTCSRKCQAVIQSIENTGSSNPNWKGGKKTCIDCGEIFSDHCKRTRCRKCYLYFNRGENHWNYKDGLHKQKYPTEFNARLKKSIRERDNYTCQLCGKTEEQEIEEFERVLCVNHIDFNKNNCSLENLNTLCLRCNLVINYDREKWTNYFKQTK